MCHGQLNKSGILVDCCDDLFLGLVTIVLVVCFLGDVFLRKDFHHVFGHCVCL